MKKYLALGCALFLATSAYSEDLNDQYPKTREERQAEEIGSVLGGEGLVVRGGSKESVTAAEGSFNAELWQAAQEVGDVAPFALVDNKSGTLSTDWYSTKEEPNASMKLTIKITGAKLARESLQVKMQKRTMKNGVWVDENAKPATAADLATKIVNRAKNIAAKK